MSKRIIGSFSFLVLLLFSINCSSQTITTGVIIGSPFCACSNLNVDFTSTGIFNAGNNYIAELSDASGSFISPVFIGSLSSTSNTGTISCTIPCVAGTGSLYRIRVTSDNPVIIGTDNGIDLTINQNVTASVNAFANIVTICTGAQVDFTATPTNGGATPAYQWQINGTPVIGSTNANYSTTTLNDQDVVTVVMTSSAACVNGSPDTSNSVTITVNSTSPAGVTISASPSTTICAGDQVDFTATGTNSGPAPLYQWQVNGGNIGTNSSTYTTTTLNNGDIVTCIMTSSNVCATNNPANSNSITITVNTVSPAGVSISATSTTICPGDPVTFTATPTNGGANPTYQWTINGTNTGPNSATFTTSGLNSGDVVDVTMNSSSSCATGSPVTSNQLTITVSSTVSASVVIIASSSTICSGQQVDFTASPTNGGIAPTYQWQINGTNVVGATNSTYSSSSLGNGDIVTCVMTSNASCVTGSPATSNSINVTVNPTVNTAINIISSSSVICSGTQVDFSASTSGGGNSPIFQWQINGSNVGTNDSTFSSTTLNNNDVITCILTSSEPCANISPITSLPVTITVTPSVVASITIVASNDTICSGDQVDFTAVPVNGGTLPSYQWQINGVNAGTNSSTFSSTTLNDNDVVTCILTSNANCATNSPATSNPISITVITSSVATVSISTSATTVCPGVATDFSAVGVNGGTAPIYDWILNGTSTGVGGTSYTGTFVNGDVISCVMTSNAQCVTSNPATSNQITLTVLPELVIVVDPDTIVSCWDKPVRLTASGANSFEWEPADWLSCTSCASTEAQPTDTTIYTVTGTTGSCTGSATVAVFVHCPDVFVPSGFSPNDDNRNDVFKIYGPPMNEFTMWVYDRWGELVYMSHDQNAGWDGTLFGKKCNTGVYVWMFRGKDPSGRNISISRTNSGSVMLIR